MRFRSKFAWMQSVTSAIWLVLGTGWIVRYAHGRADDFHLTVAATQVGLGLLWFGLYAFCWWEIGDAGLVQRWGWVTKVVPWSEITRVAPWQPGKKPVYSRLAVNYARSGPMSDRGTMVLAPADCGDVLRALRAHAPHAEFDAFPSKS